MTRAEVAELVARATQGPWDCWDMDEFGWHVFADKFGTRELGQNCDLSIAAVRLGRSHERQAENYFEQVANARLIAAVHDIAATALSAMDERDAAMKKRDTALQCWDDEAAQRLHMETKVIQERIRADAAMKAVEDMREKAAQICDRGFNYHAASLIRALPAKEG